MARKQVTRKAQKGISGIRAFRRNEQQQMIGTKSKGFQRRAKSGDKRGEKAHKGKNKDTLMRMRQVDENTRKKGHTIEKQARVVIYLESSDIQYTNKAKCSSDRPVN
jgi:hypothetical protein